MKKSISLLLAIVMIAALLGGCGKTTSTSSADSTSSPAQDVQISSESEKVEYTDDTGRTVLIPSKIEKIAISGPLSQVYVLPIASDMLVGSCMEFSSDAKKYLSDKVINLPQLGQLYGGKGTMDLEGLLKADPDIVLDVGSAKKTMVEDFDTLTEQTGIPFIHIDASVDTASEAYIKIGKLLGKEDKAKELSDFLSGIYTDMTAMMEKVDRDGNRKTVIYCLGEDGLHVLADGSYHAETLKSVATNVALVSDVVSSGDGNEVDMEQIMLWNPEIILFENSNAYNNAQTSEIWGNLEAVKNGTYYTVPCGPYGWLATPPAVQRYLGIMWLENILYPEYCEFNLQDKVTEYYKLFYDYDLTEEDFNELTKNSLDKK